MIFLSEQKSKLVAEEAMLVERCNYWNGTILIVDKFSQLHEPFSYSHDSMISAWGKGNETRSDLKYAWSRKRGSKGICCCFAISWWMQCNNLFNWLFSQFEWITPRQYLYCEISGKHKGQRYSPPIMWEFLLLYLILYSHWAPVVTNARKETISVLTCFRMDPQKKPRDCELRSQTF